MIDDLAMDLQGEMTGASLWQTLSALACDQENKRKKKNPRRVYLTRYDEEQIDCKEVFEKSSEEGDRLSLRAIHLSKIAHALGIRSTFLPDLEALNRPRQQSNGHELG